MIKNITTYQSITDLLVDHGYTIDSSGTNFFKGSIVIPASLIPKHSVKTFYELAVKNKWFEEADTSDSDYSKQFANIYGLYGGYAHTDLIPYVSPYNKKINQAMKETIMASILEALGDSLARKAIELLEEGGWTPSY